MGIELPGTNFLLPVLKQFLLHLRDLALKADKDSGGTEDKCALLPSSLSHSLTHSLTHSPVSSSLALPFSAPPHFSLRFLPSAPFFLSSSITRSFRSSSLRSPSSSSLPPLPRVAPSCFLLPCTCHCSILSAYFLKTCN
eukprot:639857-Rhodomonas_salina.5